MESILQKLAPTLFKRLQNIELLLIAIYKKEKSMSVSLSQFQATLLSISNDMNKIASGIADLRTAIGGLKEGEELQVLNSLDDLHNQVKAIADAFSEPVTPA